MRRAGVAGARRSWGRRRLRGRMRSWGCGSHWSQRGTASGRGPQGGGLSGWQAAVGPGGEQGDHVSSTCSGHPHPTLPYPTLPKTEGRERRVEVEKGRQDGVPNRAHHKRGPYAERMGGHRPRALVGVVGHRPGPASASAWSPGAGTYPGLLGAGDPWAAGGKLLPLSWWGKGPEVALPVHGISHLLPRVPTSRRCSIHSARSFHQRSLRHRSRSLHPQARCPGAPSRRLRSHLRAQTGGQTAQCPGLLATSI